MGESIFLKKEIKQRFKKIVALWLAAVLFLFILPFAAQASIYQPGATLNPDCPPSDSTSTCGVITPASAGSNSNITSLHGLTTPLSVGQGGTGLATAGLDGQALMSSGGALAWTTLNTSAVPESGPLYFTPTRARSAISSTAAGLSYASSTGIFSLNSGYEITRTASSSQWNSLYHNPAAIYGASGNLAWTGNSIGVAANYAIPLAASSTQWNNLKSGVITSVGGNLTFTNNALGVNASYAIPLIASSTQWDNWKSSIAIIPSAASSSQWNSFYHNPSLVIATSSNLQWVKNTLGVMPGYFIPLTASTTDWNALKQNQITLKSFSSSMAGLNYNTTTGVFSAASGYEMPTSANVSQWNNFYSNPSSVISAGVNCSWSGNTFNCSGGNSGTSSPLTYSAGGSLLQLQGTVFSVKEGTLTEGKGCTYDALGDLVCNSDFIGLSSLSSSATGLTYNNSTGQFSWNANYNLPLTASTTQWNAMAHASSSGFNLNAISSLASGLHYDNTSGQFSWDSGYGGYLTASGTNWQTFYANPSNRITAANNLAWNGNSLGVAANYEIPLAASSTQWNNYKTSIANIPSFASTTQWNVMAHNNNIPSTASTSQWNTFYHNPSAIISTTNNLAWNGNTLGVATNYEIPRSASTTQWNAMAHNNNIPSTASTTQWNKFFHASTSLALSSSLNSYLLRSASTTIPGLISTASSSTWNALQYSKKGWADFSNTATGLTYNNTTGATTFTSGYTIPLTASSTQWNKFFHASTSLALASNLNSYLLRSASTTIPGLVSTASTTQYSQDHYNKKGWADFSNTATGLTYNIRWSGLSRQ